MPEGLSIIDKFSDRYSFLSNFYQQPFHYDGHLARTSEHHFQAAKAMDKEDAFRIRTAASPGLSKKWGREVTRRPDWDEVKIQIMTDILMEKFGQCLNLRRALLDTGDAELIEGNTWGDTFWGVCKGKGENHLGRVLMRVRQHYRSEA